MAEKKAESVDQGKVTAKAEQLAKGTDTPQTGPVTPETTQTPAPETPDVNTAPNPKVPEPKPQQPAPVETISADKAVADQHEQLVKQYGQGYVTATKGGITTTFSQTAWDRLGKDKDGWKIATKKPQEVKDLEAKKAAEKQ